MMRRRLIFLLLLLPLVSGCLGAASGTAVRGKVNFERQPAAGVTVEAYRAGAPYLADSPDFRSPVTTDDGVYRLDLPPGSYYLFARGDGLFAYYGRNPVTVPEGGLDQVSIGLVRLPSTTAAAGDGLVNGRVTNAGQGQSDAVIFIYTDLTTQLKGMGYMMAGPTDEQGRFELALPDGTYYVVARKRQGNMAVGPLRSGDFIGYYPGNPLHIRDGKADAVEIPMLEVPEKVDTLSHSLFGQTSVSGRITDKAGLPVSGVRVVLYARPQMLDRPLFVSQPTGDDGLYVLSMPKGGVYYLGARNTLGGAPGPGDLYGTYDANPDHRIEIESGAALEGIDMTVEEMW